MKMTALDKLTWVLIIVGGLNWGMIGFFKYNLVDKVFGFESMGARVVYAIIGLAAVYSLYKMVTMMNEKSE